MFGGFSGFGTSKADSPSATAPETPTKQGAGSNLFGSTSSGGSLFGNTSTPTGGGNLFGSSSTSFSFSGAAASTKPTEPASTAAPATALSFGSGGGNLFGSSAATTKPPPAAVTSTFGSGSGSLFGSSAATTKPPPAPTSTFGLGSGSLFGSTAAAAAASTSATKPSDPVGDKSEKTPAATAGGFKLSITPVVSEPPKEQEEKKKETASDRASKLENATDLTNAALRGKTLEEIAQMWTTELAAQTRQFHSQANTVSYWDRALVQQGKRITELYEATMAVEAEQAGLDQSLEHMEGQQKALENLLDAYEGRVQEIVQKTMPQRATTGGALTADEERDHVYSSAERLNMQLDELARRLTTLVEDVNGISEGEAADQGKEERTADAFGQIVQILNSHLSSLEWVDSQTAQLQERVKNAQKIYQEVNAVQTSLSEGVGNNTERTFMAGNNGEMVPPVTSSFGAPFGAGARKPGRF